MIFIVIVIIQLINIYYFINSKNIILPFKRFTIENFNQKIIINDLLNYNIYTNISIGTPPQKVAHFIDKNDYWYYFKTIVISYKKEKSKEITKVFENLTNFWFSENISSTYILNKNEGYFSDIYYFQTLNHTQIKVDNFRSNSFSYSHLDKNKCGIIGLKYKPTSLIESTIYINFFNELKKYDLIKEYYLTFIYEKKK